MKPKLHWSVKESWRRMIESLAPIIQIVLGATAGYAIAHYGLGHEVPLLAVTVTITSLGFSRDARPKRVLETATGMVVGIALSEVLLGVLRPGIWQMSLTLLICLVSARFISGSATFALTVGLQAMLVQILPAPDGGVFIRSLDGLIGGITALVVTALIPRDPRGLARTDASKLFPMKRSSAFVARSRWSTTGECRSTVPSRSLESRRSCASTVTNCAVRFA
jgi:uncharacterized membrane protein YgaE (UPF0421/DUF939 family)